jgi:hypothetical protein
MPSLGTSILQHVRCPRRIRYAKGTGRRTFAKQYF